MKMNRRTRSILRSEPYLKYLKPGTLAQLRDSRISATRLHRTASSFSSICSSLLHLSDSPPDNRRSNEDPINTIVDGSPCFSGRICGPRCLQRKKLVAAKAVWFVGPASPVENEPDPVVDLFGNDVLVAH